MLAVVGSEVKIARLVANMIAHKAHFNAPLKLHRKKRCVRLLATAHRCKVAKLRRSAPFSALHDV